MDLKSVSSKTNEQLARVKQTVIATIESKKEILMQSARTDKDHHHGAFSVTPGKPGEADIRQTIPQPFSMREAHEDSHE